MAIQCNWTSQETGVTLNQAYARLGDPYANDDTHQVSVFGTVWESKASYDAGKKLVGDFVANLDSTVYDALRAASMDVVEPALVAELGGDAERVPD